MSNRRIKADFNELMDQFRRIAHLPLVEIQATMGIPMRRVSHLAKAYRRETGKLTKFEAFDILFSKVLRYVGDRDPRDIKPRTIAKDLDITPTQASRAKERLLRDMKYVGKSKSHTVLLTEKPPEPVVHKKPSRLFWTVGNRLFCEHREPQEVTIGGSNG